MKNSFYNPLNIEIDKKLIPRQFSKITKIPIDSLNYYNQYNILPSGDDLLKICRAANISELDLMFKMGIVNSDVIALIQENAEEISQILKKENTKSENVQPCPELKKNINGVTS